MPKKQISPQTTSFRNLPSRYWFTGEEEKKVFGIQSIVTASGVNEETHRMLHLQQSVILGASCHAWAYIEIASIRVLGYWKAKCHELKPTIPFDVALVRSADMY